MKRTSITGEPVESDRTATDGNHLDVNRRRLLKAGVVTATIAAAGGGPGTAIARSTDWDDTTLTDQLKVVREATQPFKRLENMADAGYVSAPIPIVCSEGLHFDNAALWEKGELDPENPQSLFYMVDENGKLELGGAEFILPTELDENDDPKVPKPDLFNDESEPLEGDTLRGTPEEDGWILIEDPGTGMHIWDLHVWVHERNPEGVFSLPNSRFANMPGCVPLEEL
ncbi:hypothetical protein [Halomicrococcus sp. SG-WS-1]|uniref:hypothetical protein n=1 Tax=Halomicrococcus sp. SG-WS-1 TaxID=3439057 RepID=UPI003F7972BC